MSFLMGLFFGWCLGMVTMPSLELYRGRRGLQYVRHERTDRGPIVTVRVRPWFRQKERVAIKDNEFTSGWYWADTGEAFTDRNLVRRVRAAELEEERLEELLGNDEDDEAVWNGLSASGKATYARYMRSRRN